MGNVHINELSEIAYLTPESNLVISAPNETGGFITHKVSLTKLYGFFRMADNGNRCSYCNSIGSLNEKNICRNCGAPKK